MNVDPAPTASPDLASLCLAITEHAPLPMAAVEGATRLVRHANPAFCRLMKKPLEEIRGRRFDDLLPAKDECISLLERVFRTGDPAGFTEADPTRPHPVFWSYKMWPMHGGEGIVGIVIQVTETAQFHETARAMNEALVLGAVRQHELTEAAENLNHQLREEIASRRVLEETLASRAADLIRADRSKDEFLAMLAHELRNPLASLRNAAEIHRERDATHDDREQAQRILERQIENMTRMIDDLLDVARITQGKIELRQKVGSLEAILTAAVTVVRPVLEGRGQELAVTLPAELVLLQADATRLEQVFVNLLTNASKYSGAGTRITLRAERVPAVGPEPPKVLVSVGDDGMGIASELLPRVFDLFVQASRTLHRAHGGLGIGLTLVRRLVELHGGSVEARSEGIGRGSEFLVRLPMLPGTAGAAPAPIAPPENPVHDTPRRILVVDDNEDSARSMSLLQRRRGHATRTAFTGPEAVTAAAEFLPEVVLLDIGLPGMDGFEVARRLREMPALDGVFLVAMTGYGEDADRARAKAAGFDEYLVKPVDLALLREWLRQRSAGGGS